MKDIKVIPATKTLHIGEPVAIYARVSTTSREQLRSLQNQITKLTEQIYRNANEKIADVFMDFSSAKTDAYRSEWSRMLSVAGSGKFKKIYTKSVTRFGRDTVEGLQAVRFLKSYDIEVVFDMEHISSFDSDFELTYTVAASIGQADNADRSENIRKGIEMHSQDANSKLYNRKCYGYEQDEKGELVINEKEAEIVRFIFERYISGASVKVISRELSEKSIPSPTGKEKWSNRTIDTILQNEKYTGTVYLYKTVSGMYPNVKGTRILDGIPAVMNHHEAIITEDIFNRAKNRRSHIAF